MLLHIIIIIIIVGRNWIEAYDNAPHTCATICVSVFHFIIISVQYLHREHVLSRSGVFDVNAAANLMCNVCVSYSFRCRGRCSQSFSLLLCCWVFFRAQSVIRLLSPAVCNIFIRHVVYMV